MNTRRQRKNGQNRVAHFASASEAIYTGIFGIKGRYKAIDTASGIQEKNKYKEKVEGGTIKLKKVNKIFKYIIDKSSCYTTDPPPTFLVWLLEIGMGPPQNNCTKNTIDNCIKNTIDNCVKNANSEMEPGIDWLG